jgi:alkylhydroperoxidase family enzyme
MKLWHFPVRFFYLALGFLAPVVIAAEPAPSMAEIRAREAYILGSPPRILPLHVEQFDEKSDQVVTEIWKAMGRSPEGEMPEYFTTMLRHPELMQRHVELSTLFFRGELSARDRELAILRIAWLCQAPYEWGEHVRMGKRVANFTPEEIEWITHGSVAPGWNEHEQAVLRAVEELYANAMISDKTWEVLARQLNDKQLLELPLLIGTYQSVAYLQNAVRFRLRPGNVGLSAR